jgi:osmotically-inducible protein OsmY
MFRYYCAFFIFLPFLLTSCLPVVFTAATTSTLAAAKDRSIGSAIDDTKIAASIKASFIKNNFKELYTKIKVEVLQSRVLLTGTVNKEEDTVTAVKIAWEQQYVKEVINELKVDEKSSHFDLLQYTKDTMITSQIKSKLFLCREIKCVNYTVITLNNIVYLLGIARSESELEKVTDIASKVKGVEKVISHATIKEKRPDIE